MDEVDNNLKNLFCTAANSVTQIYMKSLENQRTSYNIGVNDTIEKVANFVDKNSTKIQGKTIIDAEKLIEFLKLQNNNEKDIKQNNNSNWNLNRRENINENQQQNGWSINSKIPNENFNFSEQKPFIFQPNVFQENTNNNNNITSTSSSSSNTFQWNQQQQQEEPEIQEEEEFVNDDKKRDLDSPMESQIKRIKFF